MVLAAGLGVRMRPITEHLPKPLIEIGGRTMLDRILDALDQAGVEQVVVNAHYLAHLIERHLTARRAPPVRLCVEAERLETGGGVANALPMLGAQPFFVVNGDVLWRDGTTPTLDDLAVAWDDARMDALLLLHPLATALGYDGPGDFTLAKMAGWLAVRTMRTHPSCSPASRSCIPACSPTRLPAPSRSTSSSTGRSRQGGCSASSTAAAGATSARLPTLPPAKRSCASPWRSQIEAWSSPRSSPSPRACPSSMPWRRACGCVWARRRKRWPTPGSSCRPAAPAGR